MENNISENECALTFMLIMKIFWNLYHCHGRPDFEFFFLILIVSKCEFKFSCVFEIFCTHNHGYITSTPLLSAVPRKHSAPSCASENFATTQAGVLVPAVLMCHCWLFLGVTGVSSK